MIFADCRRTFTCCSTEKNIFYFSSIQCCCSKTLEHFALDIRKSNTTSIFRKLLRIHLYKQAYEHTHLSAPTIQNIISDVFIDILTRKKCSSLILFTYLFVYATCRVHSGSAAVRLSHRLGVYALAEDLRRYRSLSALRYEQVPAEDVRRRRGLPDRRPHHDLRSPPTRQEESLRGGRVQQEGKITGRQIFKRTRHTRD